MIYFDNNGQHWDAGDRLKLTLAYPRGNLKVLARQLGRTVSALRFKAYGLGLLRVDQNKLPSRRRYVEILRRECSNRKACLKDALNGERIRPYPEIRWRAFAEMRKQKFSMPAIGAAAGGFDHSSVAHGLRRLAEMEQRA